MANQREDRFTELEEGYAGYEVYDPQGEKIGKVDDLFIDENDRTEYIGVKMGFLGTKSTLIPIEAVQIDEKRRFVEVSRPKSDIKEAPAFDDDEKITPEYEEQVRRHYGLGGLRGGANRDDTYDGYHAGASRSYTGREEGSERPAGITRGHGNRKRDELREHRPSPELESVSERGRRFEDEDELRVQRAEEELRAGTREREVGAIRVRKRVRIDREQVRVPKRREELHVERVLVEGREASEAEIGEDEIVVPVTEEEVVVEKRPEVKEEIHLHKDVVQEEEVVEEDVRREEVEIEDETERRTR